jgi:hypothetical protein
MNPLKSIQKPSPMQAVTNAPSTTQGASTKADIYATPEKYTQVTVDIYASLGELRIQGCYLQC